MISGAESRKLKADSLIIKMRVYVAATRQNDGKTVISLGLISVLSKLVETIGYMKPVGQQYKTVNGKMIDKDAVLMKKIFNFGSNLSQMSPIAIPPGFTEDYIMRGNRSVLVNKIKRAYRNLSKSNDFILIEGTGHAGVGSVFDMSNSDVASMLGAKVIIVTCGGIGRPIDEIMLNHAKFDAQGVEILGVIVNKVRKQKYNKINRLIRKGLARKNIEVLGVVPFEEVLSNPTVSELLEDLKGNLICGEKGLNNIVERFIIGDVVAHEALAHVAGGTLLITPGNREDVIFSALSGWVLGITEKYHISGIIATYGKSPPKKVIDVIDRANVPLIIVKEDSFSTACEINKMIFKLRSEDKAKIKKVEALVEKYVDVDRIFNMLKPR
ncbi:MAG: AAA family ATPase [Candidatus Omnitrophica bacterium]|nr:AAA family ATPase [Candidatus Omnitrophota bacterium]